LIYLVTSAWLAAAAAASPAVVSPQWVKQPGAELMQEFYPVAAELVRLPGRVMLNCMVGLEGKAEDCTVAAEAPAGLGFGAAALHLAPAFRFRPGRVGGKPERAAAMIPVRFALPDDPAAAAGKAYAPRPSSPGQQALARRLVERGAYAAKMADDLRKGVEKDVHERDGMREDPVLRAQATEALHGASEAVIADMGEMVTLALAGAFSEAELQQLLALSDEALQRRLEQRRRKIDPEGIVAALSGRMTAAAQSRFCQGRDCSDKLEAGGAAP